MCFQCCSTLQQISINLVVTFRAWYALESARLTILSVSGWHCGLQYLYKSACIYGVLSLRYTRKLTCSLAKTTSSGGFSDQMTLKKAYKTVKSSSSPVYPASLMLAAAAGNANNGAWKAWVIKLNVCAHWSIPKYF